MDTGNVFARFARGDGAEDLNVLAALEFRFAQTLCVDCQDYHALWGYLRFTGITGNSFQSDRDILTPLLHEHTPHNGHVLIAGSADAGLLSLTAAATHARMPQISVADRCGTPLAVCRHYAQGLGFPVATIEQDLTNRPISAKFDLAFVHNILMLMPLERHVAFLRNLRLALEPGGALVLVNRSRPSGWVATPPAPEHYASRVMDAMTAHNIALPEAADAFRRRLEAFAVAQRVWSYAIVERHHVETSLREAGFEIVSHTDHERRRTAPERDGGQPIPMKTHIFVARPTKEGRPAG